MRAMPRKFDQLVSGRFEPKLTCRFYESVLWRDRDVEIRRLGFRPIPRESWSEVDRAQAIDLLASAMSTDLCYGAKVFPRGTAKELSEQFCASFHWQARFFTNSEKPWQPSLNGWIWAPLTDATIDTGVIAKTGDLFAGICWIASWD